MIQMSSPPANLPFLRLSMSAGQSTTSTATPTKLAFDVVSDKSADWPTVTTPVSNIVIPYTGYILVVAHDLDWQDAAITISTGVRKLGRELSGGAGTRRQGSIMVGAGGATNNQSVQSFSEVLYLPAGETISIILAQVSGSTLVPAINDVFLQYLLLGTRTLVGTN